MSLPPTPLSIASDPDRDQAVPAVATSSSEQPIISLIAAVFPEDARSIASLSHTLEIVTPPDHVLNGFTLDHPSCGRTVYIHLPPVPSPSLRHTRPETLSPNFSQVLRPHDPLMHQISSSPTTTQRNYAFDIRESLTALLDLASEALDARSLILILDRDERELEGLGELLHSLMYVGGQVIKAGALDAGWAWDATRWVLVGMEL